MTKPVRFGVGTLSALGAAALALAALSSSCEPCPNFCGDVCAGRPEPRIPDHCPIPACACEPPSSTDCHEVVCADHCASLCETGTWPYSWPSSGCCPIP